MLSLTDIQCLTLRNNAADKHHRNNFERTSTIFVTDVRESPNVPKINCESDNREKEVEFSAPGLSLGRSIIVRRCHLSVLFAQGNLFTETVENSKIS